MAEAIVRRCIVPLLASVLGACAMGPELERPELALPDAWPSHVFLSDTERDGWEGWWAQFGDPTLDALIARAVRDNLELRLQVDRIREARAALGLTRAGRYPTIDAQAEALRQRQPGYLSMPGGDGGGAPTALEQLDALEQALRQRDEPSGALSEAVQGLTQGDSAGGQGRGPLGNVLSVSGALAYEVDLWGRLARQLEGAEALLEQTVFVHDAIRLQVVADVVALYVNLRGTQQRLAIAERTATAREETLALERVRHEGGGSDALSVRQAESLLASARSRIPVEAEQVRLIQTALGTLVGMTPAELFEGLEFGEGDLNGLRVPTGVPTVLPSELLQRRPDIRAAEAELVAANAFIGVAMAERLPQVNLAGFLGSTALELGDLFSAPAHTWGMSASVAGTLFDFGRHRARVAITEAQRDQAETRYRATVQTAFREVRDALIMYDASVEQVAAASRLVEAVGETLRLAEIRYREGYVSFFEVLDAQRMLLEGELMLSGAQRDRLLATAALFKALGGGFGDTE